MCFCGGMIVVATCRWVGSCVLRGLSAFSTRPQTRGAATGGDMSVGRELRVKRAVSPLYAPSDPWRHRAFSIVRPCLSWWCVYAGVGIASVEVGDGRDVGTAPRTRA